MGALWKGEWETLDALERDARLRARLAERAEGLYAASPGIRRRLDDAGIGPAELSRAGALAGLPVITKAEIIADQAEHPPYGTLLGADPAELVRLYVGPGPQTTYFTAADYAATVGQGAWAFATNGFERTDIVDVTIMYHWVIAGTLMDESFRQIGCATLPGGIGMTATHLENLRLLRATGLFAFPTFLEELSHQAEELGVDPVRDLSLRLCTIAGELRSADVHERMQRFWGMTVREIYGGAEIPFIAAQCGESAGMHLNPDFLVEVLHAETQEPVAAGEPGVVVATELDRLAYPMLRYWTGDITEGLDTTPCPCGRTTPRLGRILGRVGDIARIKGLFVVPGQVAAALGTLDDLGRFQLVVDRPGTQDTVLLRVEHAGAAAERAALTPKVRQAVKDRIRISCDVELVALGAIPADAPVVDDRRSV